jgi:hypothetical protein
MRCPAAVLAVALATLALAPNGALGLKCLLGKNGVDPVSTEVDLTECCSGAGVSGTPVCIRFCTKDKKVTYQGVDKSVADLFVDDPTGETWDATATFVCNTDDCNIKIEKPCEYVPAATSAAAMLQAGTVTSAILAFAVALASV